MTDWSMVWLQQKGDDDETFTPRVTMDPSKPLSLQLQKSVTNLQKPTKSRQAKVENIWMKRSRVLSYVNQGKYEWNKMPLFEDCHRCMYTKDGTVKGVTKL